MKSMTTRDFKVFLGNPKSGVYRMVPVGRPFTLSRSKCGFLEFLTPGSYRLT